ncbi:MAG: DEAD/DEAH box helicase [Fibrobacteres bacterium]|nr:DEAD/DEAH box helicase [Fibrobacterota bacterium]
MPFNFLKKLLKETVRLATFKKIVEEPQPTPKAAPKDKRITRHVPAAKKVYNAANPNIFYGLGLSPNILEQIETEGFHTPTPIQEKCIPSALAGQDVMGIAQTGTGKTLAFGLPILQRLSSSGDTALILAPTRELALQIEDALMPFSKITGIKSTVLIGGASMHNQITALRKNPRMIIATPGRLIDLMEQRVVNLSRANILVLDEADRMLDMGFAPQLIRILKNVPKERQTMLFSATMPPTITAIATSYMKLPIRIEVAPPGTAAESIKQELFVVARDNRIPLLEKLLKDHTGSTLIFTRTKRGAAKVALLLRKRGINASEIHSDRTLSQRTEALDGFKSGRFRVLVATDIAARGIDVTGIELVVNFDLPDDAENYVHRIGRTGRAGRIGHAISIASPDQGREVAEIERLIKTSIAVSSHPEIQSETLLKSSHRTIKDILYGPPKGKRTGRERPIMSIEERPAHKKEWGR